MTTTIEFAVDPVEPDSTARLAYERSGAGEPVLLLHGLGHRRQAWDPVSPALRAHHELIAVDLPGFGESEPMPADIPADLSGYSTVLAAFCRALGLKRPHIVGNSLGGLIALDMARLGHASSVTAISPAGFWTPLSGRRALAMAAYMRLGARALPVPVIKKLARSPQGRFLLTSVVYAQPARLAAEYAIDDTLGYRNCTGFEATLAQRHTLQLTGDITDVDVTVAWGEKDRMLPPRQAATVTRIVPEARLVSLPDCGHTPMVDDPELVTRVILATTGRTTTR